VVLLEVVSLKKEIMDRGLMRSNGKVTFSVEKVGADQGISLSSTGKICWVGL